MHAISNGRSRAIVATGAAVALATGVLLAVPKVDAAPMALEGLTASATVKAPREATWYGQLDATGFCRLFPGCIAVSATDADHFTMTVIGFVPGIGEVSQQVAAAVVQRQAPSRMTLDLASSGAAEVGEFTGQVTVTLGAKGKGRTDLAVQVVRASGTGLVGSVMIPFLEANLQAGLTDSVAGLNETRRAAAISAKVSGKPARNKKGKKVKGRTAAKVVVSADAVTYPLPQASGTARLVNAKTGSRVCTATVRRSVATCTYKTAKAPKKLRVVVTGAFDNGYQVWESVTGKVTR